MSSTENSEETTNTTMTSHKILDKLQHTTSAAVRVYVIRHGETNWNKLGKIQGGGYNVPLNDNGRDQAKMTAQALEGIQFDAVASSSLLRAEETADILHAYCKANNSDKEPLRIIDTGFHEMRFGRFEGLSRAQTSKDPDLKAHFLEEKKKVWEDYTYCFPSRETPIDPDDEVFKIDGAGWGESINIVEDRVMRALSETVKKVLNETKDDETTTTTKHVAIVSHGRTNKVLIGGMLGDGSTRKIEQSNANISVLDHPGWETTEDLDAKGGWTKKIVNFTEHVKGKLTNVKRAGHD